MYTQSGGLGAQRFEKQQITMYAKRVTGVLTRLIAASLLMVACSDAAAPPSEERLQDSGCPPSSSPTWITGGCRSAVAEAPTVKALDAAGKQSRERQ